MLIKRIQNRRGKKRIIASTAIDSIFGKPSTESVVTNPITQRHDGKNRDKYVNSDDPTHPIGYCSWCRRVVGHHPRDSKCALYMTRGECMRKERKPEDILGI